MLTFSRIQRFLTRIKKNEMFTTRQLLAFGERNTIDQITHKLVKNGVLIRVAFGVFVLAGSDLSRITVADVAKVKALAFQREIVEHASDAGERLGIESPSNDGPTYSTRARSSSFMMLITKTRIYFKGVSARKFYLAGTHVGDILRSLWNLTEEGCTKQALKYARSIMASSHRRSLPEYASRIPAWLHQHFAFAWT